MVGFKKLRLVKSAKIHIWNDDPGLMTFSRTSRITDVPGLPYKDE